MRAVAVEDLVNSVPRDQQANAEHFFQRVFDSLMWTRVIDGKVQDVSAVKQWKHREPAEVESDLAYLEINRNALLSALSHYLSNPRIASKYADWLFLNILSYAEYIATVSETRKTLMGIERYVESLFPPKTVHTWDVSVYAKRSWHLPVALASIAVSCAIHALAGVAVTAYILFGAYRRKKAYERVNATFESMFKAYLSFNTTDLSWAHVANTLKRSSEAGAIWDASLYALAEQRAGVQPTLLPN